MRLWLRARRVPHLVAAMMIAAVLQGMLSGRTSLLPVVIGDVGVATWTMFVPVMLGIVMANSMASKTQGIEARPSAGVLVGDAVLLVAFVLCATALMVATGGGSQSVGDTFGQVALCVGLATVVTLRWGLGAGVLAPLALAVVSAAYGIDAPAGRYIRVLDADSFTWWVLFLGGLLIATGIAIIVGRKVRVWFRLADQLAD